MLTEVQEIRRQNIEKLIKREGGQPKVAEKYGCTSGNVSQWVTKKRTISEKTARKIEIKFGFPPMSFDRPLLADCSIHESDTPPVDLDFTESPAIRRLAEAVNTGALAEDDVEALEVIAERMKKPKQAKRKVSRPG